MSDLRTARPELFDLRDRVIVVTGCTGVLGSGYCRAFAKQGARVVMSDLAERDPV